MMGDLNQAIALLERQEELSRHSAAILEHATGCPDVCERASAAARERADCYAAALAILRRHGGGAQAEEADAGGHGEPPAADLGEVTLDLSLEPYVPSRIER